MKNNSCQNVARIEPAHNQHGIALAFMFVMFFILFLVFMLI